MIKRLIGSLVTVAVLAVVVMTFLHRDRFRTLLPFGEPTEQSVPVRESRPVPVEPASGGPAATVDSLSGVPELPDSLRE